jgi:hypothetical protein
MWVANDTTRSDNTLMKGPSEIGGSPRIAGDRGGTDQDSVLPEGRGVIRGYYTVRGQPRGVIGAGGIRQCPPLHDRTGGLRARRRDTLHVAGAGPIRCHKVNLLVRSCGESRRIVDVSQGDDAADR